MAVKHILLDTNAYAAFKRGLPNALEIIKHAPFIGISTIVLGELLTGFVIAGQEAKKRQETV